jgi:surface glycoprotein (TIGR04207 family)/PGF-CTERM protein
MTSKTDKLRAVFLTALMIGSVFAAGVAFTGGAAAAATNVSLSDTSVQSGTDVSGTFTNDTSSPNDADMVIVLDENGDGFFNDSEANVTTAATSGTFSGLSTDGLSEGDYTVYAFQNGTVNDGDDLEANAGAQTTLTIDNTAPSARKATHYDSTGNGTVIEVAYDESIVQNTSEGIDIDVGLEGQDDLTGLGAAAVNTTDGRLEINTSGTVYNNVANVTVNSGIEDSTGNAVSSDAIDVTFASTTVNTNNGGTTFESFTGSMVAIEGDEGDSFDVEGPSVSTTRGTGANSQVYVLNTEGFETGQYNITNNNNAEDDVVLDLGSLGLEVSPDADSYTTEDAVTAELSSDTIDREVLVEVLDADDEVVDSSEATIDSDGAASVDFGTLSAADGYTLRVTDDNTGVSATSDSFNVTEAAAASAGFVDSGVTVDRGDIGTINVSLTNSDTATVVLGSEAANYEVDFTVTDGDGDGYVAVDVNTYLTTEGGAYSVADSEDSLTIGNETTLSDVLADSTYDMSVVEGDSTSAEADALGTFTVNPRSSAEMQIWTAPQNADDIVASVSQDDTIASGDYVVHQVQTSGIYGLLEDTGGSDATAKLFNAIGNDELGVTINQTVASTGANENPVTLDLSAIDNNDGLTVVSNSTSENVYIAVDTGELATETGDPVEVGDEFTAQFSVNEDTGLVSSNQTTTATFTVDEGAEAGTEFDSDEVTVTNADNQTVSGETTLAPGTTFTVRVQSTETSGEPFIIPDDEVVVQDDGTFTAELDFSDTTVNSTFEGRVRLGSSTLDSLTGEVVESAGDGTDETTTEAPDTTTEAPDTTTEAPDTTTEAPDTTTEAPDTTTEAADTTTEGGDGEDGGSIPGFGVGIALVAVLGAALLALRE